MPLVGSVLDIFRSPSAADVEWRIVGFPTGDVGSEMWLWSPVFSSAGSEWRLVFARSDPSSGSSPVVLRLWRYTGPSPAPVVRYWLGVGRPDGEPEEEEEIGRGRMELEDRHYYVDHPWLEFSELQRRMGCLAPSGSLSFRARFRTGLETESQAHGPDTTVGGDSNSAERAEQPTQSDSEDTLILKEHFKKLLLHSKDHDILFKVKEKEFKAHKNVLRARSSVFNSMFNQEMKENMEDIIRIEDADPNCFGTFLMYVYTGEVENLPADNAMGLFYLGDKYDFPALKRRCVCVLKNSLSTSLVGDVIYLAVTHGEEELLESAMNYVTEHLVQVMETVEWQRFALKNPIQANEVSLKAIKRRLNSKPQ